MDLKLRAHDIGEVAVLSATGEIDVFTAPDLDEEIARLVSEGRSTLVVDLSQVTFLDSTGLGVLVKGLKATREAGGGLRLVVTTDRIRKIFDITGLDAAMPLFDTVDAAVTT